MTRLLSLLALFVFAPSGAARPRIRGRADRSRGELRRRGGQTLGRRSRNDLITGARTRTATKTWRRSLRLERGASRYRLWHDVHRATGLWLRGLLLMLAASGIALSLGDEVFRPAVSLFSKQSPTPLERALEFGLAAGPRTLGCGDVVAAAREIARRRGWPAEPAYVFHWAELGGFGVGVVRRGQDADVGMGRGSISAIATHASSPQT